MAISKQAEAVKQEMMQAVSLRREWEALESEWRDLLEALEGGTLLGESVFGTADEDGLTLAQVVDRERMAVRRALTERQLRNWARIRGGGLSSLQQRILGLRFVQGCTWGDLVARVGKAKQYLLREHNKALEQLALRGAEALPKKSERVS